MRNDNYFLTFDLSQNRGMRRGRRERRKKQGSRPLKICVDRDLDVPASQMSGDE